MQKMILARIKEMDKGPKQSKMQKLKKQIKRDKFKPSMHDTYPATLADSRIDVVSIEQEVKVKKKENVTNAVPTAPIGFRFISETEVTALATEGDECERYVYMVNEWYRKSMEEKRIFDMKSRVLVAQRKANGLVQQPDRVYYTKVCDIKVPECVDRYILEMCQLTVAKRAEHCRSGVGGHPGLVVARSLLLDRHAAEFAASDLQIAKERAVERAMCVQPASDHEIGPNNENTQTHRMRVETTSHGGKGQTIKTVKWTKIDTDEE